MENVTREVKQRLQFCIQMTYVFYLAIRFKLLVDFCDSHKKYVFPIKAIILLPVDLPPACPYPLFHHHCHLFAQSAEMNETSRDPGVILKISYLQRGES